MMSNALDSRYCSVGWVQFPVVWVRLRYFFLLVTKTGRNKEPFREVKFCI